MLQQTPSWIALPDPGSPLNAGRVLTLLGLFGHATTVGWIDPSSGAIARKVIGTGGTTVREYPAPGFWPDLLAPYSQALATEHMTLANFAYPKGPITIGVWAFHNSVTGAHQLAGDYTASGAKSAMVYTFSNRLQAYITTTVSGAVVVDNCGPIAINTWQHLSMTWDGSTLTGYVNGLTFAGQSLAATGASVPPTDFNLGFCTGAVAPFQGYWADVGVWNRALSQAEIQRYVAQTRFSHDRLTHRVATPFAYLPPPSTGVLPTAPNALLLQNGSNLLLQSTGRVLLQSAMTLYVPEYTTTLDDHNALAALHLRRARQAAAQHRSGTGVVDPTLAADAITMDRWYRPLAEPPRPAKAREDRRHLLPAGGLGDPPRPEATSVDKYDTPSRRVVAARPSPVQTVRDSVMDMVDTVGDPAALFMEGWNVEMRRAPAARRPPTPADPPTPLNVLTLAEDPLLKWHTPIALVPPGPRRLTDPPLGRDDLDPSLRVEVVRPESTQAMPGPPGRRLLGPPVWSPDLHGDTGLLAEAVSVAALGGRAGEVLVLRRPLAQPWSHDQPPLYDRDNFAAPLVVRTRRGMLAAGLWRARY